MCAFVTNVSPEGRLPVCITITLRADYISASSLCGSRHRVHLFQPLGLIFWALLKKKEGGSGFILAIEIPGSPQAFVLRE